MTVTPKQFAAKTQRLATTLPRAYQTATQEAALVVKEEALHQMRQVAPSGAIIKGKGKLTVRVDTKAGFGSDTLVKAVGPWPLIEDDTAAHSITSKRGGGGTRKRRAARADFIGPQIGGRTIGGGKAVLNIPGIGYRRSVRHPGTRGQHPWRKGIDKATPLTPKIYARAVHGALAREFTGG